MPAAPRPLPILDAGAVCLAALSALLLPGDDDLRPIAALALLSATPALIVGALRLREPSARSSIVVAIAALVVVGAALALRLPAWVSAGTDAREVLLLFAFTSLVEAWVAPGLRRTARAALLLFVFLAEVTTPATLHAVIAFAYLVSGGGGLLDELVRRARGLPAPPSTSRAEALDLLDLGCGGLAIAVAASVLEPSTVDTSSALAFVPIVVAAGAGWLKGLLRPRHLWPVLVVIAAGALAVQLSPSFGAHRVLRLLPWLVAALLEARVSSWQPHRVLRVVAAVAGVVAVVVFEHVGGGYDAALLLALVVTPLLGLTLAAFDRAIPEIDAVRGLELVVAVAPALLHAVLWLTRNAWMPLLGDALDGAGGNLQCIALVAPLLASYAAAVAGGIVAAARCGLPVPLAPLCAIAALPGATLPALLLPSVVGVVPYDLAAYVNVGEAIWRRGQYSAVFVGLLLPWTLLWIAWQWRRVPYRELLRSTS